MSSMSTFLCIIVIFDMVYGLYFYSVVLQAYSLSCGVVHIFTVSKRQDKTTLLKHLEQMCICSFAF